MRVLGIVALLLASTSCLPAASAQVPEPPAPGDVVALACATVGGIEPQARDLLPLCDAAEPAPPGAPDDAAPAAAPAPPGDTAPEDAQRLAEDVADEAGEIADDPASAPDRAQNILATIVAFIERLLGIPATIGATLDARLAALGDALQSAGAGIAEGAKSAADGIKSATTGAAESVKSAATGAADAVRALFAGLAPTSDAPARDAAKPRVRAPDADALLPRLPDLGL